MAGFLKQVFIFIAILALVVLGRYYYFVNYEDTPYGEVGLGLHDVLPSQIQDYGCKRLRERFPTELIGKCGAVDL